MFTKTCGKCGAEMYRDEVLINSAVNDREEDKFATIWVCSDDECDGSES